MDVQTPLDKISVFIIGESRERTENKKVFPQHDEDCPWPSHSQSYT